MAGKKKIPLPFRGLAATITLCVFLNILSLIASQSAIPDDVFDIDDKMTNHEKQTIKHLSEDLFKDSLLKMRQIVKLRKHYDKQVGYNIGIIIGRVREKYRYMLEIYRDVLSTFTNLNRARPPSFLKFYTSAFIMSLELMHYLELEIDKLVDVILEEAAEDAKGNFNIAGQAAMNKGKEGQPNRTVGVDDKGSPPNQTLNKGSPPKSANKGHGRVGTDRRLEEAEKSIIRQRYLMKKLGQPINMTTMKKRFIRRWPVEDSWHLDKYNYNYK